MRHLKTGRIVVSLLFLILISLLFLDISGGTAARLSVVLVSLQLLPSFLKMLGSLGLHTLGCLFVLVVTLLFGRVYCSSICPLGTLQDAVIAAARKSRGTRMFGYTAPQTRLHYSLLAGTVLLFAAGSVLLLDLLDPFSNFGRIATSLLRPVVVVGNNLAAWGLERFGIYSVAPVPFRVVGVGTLALSMIILYVVGYLAYNHGRLFCNSICPVGAVLGLISRVSLFRLVFDGKTCKDCGLCAKVCKANCIDAKEKVLDFSRCVSCYNCVDDCPTVGVKYEFSYNRRSRRVPEKVDAGRRTVLARSVQGVVGGIAAISEARDSASVKSMYESKPPVTPPGSRSTDHFTGRCTACYLCVSACPTQVIEPTFLKYGVSGILQPELDYSRSYCKYECTVCTDVCPSGAILPLTVDQKKETQVGRATFIKDDCIVITKKTECGACSEHCPTKAVNMVKHEGLFLPEVKEEICVGCGACEHACPTKPRKAIYVASNPLHRTAKKPEVRPAEMKHQEPLDFPF